MPSIDPTSVRSSPAASGRPDWISEELVQLTIKTWQPYYTDVLTREEAVIMIASVGQLFEVLSRGSNHEEVRSLGAGQ